MVVGNPANTNCFILAHYAPSIPRENFSCLTRLDHNRAIAQIASKLKVSPSAVKNVTIWGNHSSTQFPDARSATVNIDGKELPVYDAIKDDHWLKNDFVSVKFIFSLLSIDDPYFYVVDRSKTRCCCHCSTKTFKCDVCSQSDLRSYARLVAWNQRGNQNQRLNHWPTMDSFL